MKLTLFKNLCKDFVVGLLNSWTFLPVCWQSMINYLKIKHCESLYLFWFFLFWWGFFKWDSCSLNWRMLLFYSSLECPCCTSLFKFKFVFLWWNPARVRVSGYSANDWWSHDSTSFLLSYSSETLKLTKLQNDLFIVKYFFLHSVFICTVLT